jgi:hypothetical protein
MGLLQLVQNVEQFKKQRSPDQKRQIRRSGCQEMITYFRDSLAGDHVEGVNPLERGSKELTAKAIDIAYQNPWRWGVVFSP